MQNKSALVLIAAGNNECCQPKGKKRTPKGLLAYLKWLRNQNGEDLVNLYVSINFKTQLIFAAYDSELTWTLFPVESTDSKKIKITLHRVTGYGCILEGMPFMRMSFVRMRFHSRKRFVHVCIMQETSFWGTRSILPENN